jgi:hypothetical protein
MDVFAWMRRSAKCASCQGLHASEASQMAAMYRRGYRIYGDQGSQCFAEGKLYTYHGLCMYIYRVSFMTNSADLVSNRCLSEMKDHNGSVCVRDCVPSSRVQAAILRFPQVLTLALLKIP